MVLFGIHGLCPIEGGIPFVSDLSQKSERSPLRVAQVCHAQKDHLLAHGVVKVESVSSNSLQTTATTTTKKNAHALIAQIGLLVIDFPLEVDDLGKYFVDIVAALFNVGTLV